MEVDDDSNANRIDSLQRDAALFLSTIRDRYKTSQASVDFLVKGVDNLFNKFLDILEDSFVENCSKYDGYIKLKQVKNVIASFKDQSLFEGVGKCDIMESYLREHSGGEKVVLKKVILSHRTIIRQGVARQVPQDYGYIVPFLPQLEQTLNCDDVLECVDNPLPQEKGTFENINHGYFYKHHPVVKEHGEQTLAIEIHVDDVEVCDPCKSKANKHNLRLFYWKLGNLHPDKKSSLKVNNLLAIVKTKVAKKWGNHHFLHHFIKDMNTLGKEGVVFVIHEKPRIFFGILLCVSADNPAAANLGGFKETHCALRPCRMCMILSTDLCKDFVQSNMILRNLTEHNLQLKQIVPEEPKVDKVKIIDILENETEEDIVGFEEQLVMKYSDHPNPSINFGINSESVLSNAPGFDVTKCLLQDIMHVLAEGVCDLLCRLLLKDACFPPPDPAKGKKKKKVLKLDDVNNTIQNLCDFSHLNKSRPSLIEKAHVMGMKLKQSASQMLVLIRVLPFLLVKNISEEKQQLLTKFLSLLNVFLSYKLTRADVVKMENLVEDFGSQFHELYPDVRTLKLHVLVHLAMQARLFGPLRLHWCFGYEAMHSQFTSLVPVVRSKKDLAFSIARRHLSKRNAEILKAKETGKYLSEDDGISGAQDINVSELPESVRVLFPDIPVGTTVQRVLKLTRSGQVWGKDVAIMIDKSRDNPLFGKIECVYKVGVETIFVFHKYKTTFLPRLHAYQIDDCESDDVCIMLRDLAHPFPIARFSFHFPVGVMAYLIPQSDF